MNVKNSYTKWAIFFLIVAMVSFIPRYWLPLLKGKSDFPEHLHWHAVFTYTWIILYVIQTYLIKARQIKWHQVLGLTSVVFTLGILWSGYYITMGLAERTLDSSAGARPVILINFLDLFLFGLFYVLGLLSRTNGLWHKRYMTLAALALLNAAFFRIGAFIIGSGFPSIVLAIVTTNAIIMFYVFKESARNRTGVKRLGWIAFAILFIHIVRIPIAISPLWSDVADFLLRLY